MSIDEPTQQQLRAPFPDSEIGYLPKVWCQPCREAAGKACSNHRRQKCRSCGSNITNAHVDLAYVGHAEVTDRLLQVDPGWNWEPVAWGSDGLPAFDRLGGLWIRLTIAGTTRHGYGHADGKTGGDAIKEVIGDALRNASMRFGVGLDLWRRSESSAAEPSEAPRLRQEIADLAGQKGYDLPAVERDFTQAMNGAEITTASVALLAEYRDRFKDYPDAE